MMPIPHHWYVDRYDENPKCSFDKDRLHFAVHVRMGDRREFQDGNAEYFRMLELIMATISAEVVGRGLSAPLFHVFSETVLPCPSGEAGLFEEFPTWPVGVDKVRLFVKFGGCFFACNAGSWTDTSIAHRHPPCVVGPFFRSSCTRENCAGDGPHRFLRLREHLLRRRLCRF